MFAPTTNLPAPGSARGSRAEALETDSLQGTQFAPNA
jgi:hypothetical protein